MTTDAPARRVLWRRLVKILLIPVVIYAGIFLGVFVGAVYLPYLVLIELVRKIAQSWDYLKGWADWAESGGKVGEPKKGWMGVWAVWAVLYFTSMFTWAPMVGVFLGPFVGLWLLFAEDGWARLMRTASSSLQRIRRMRIKVSVDTKAA